MSSRLRQLESHLEHQSNNSRFILPPICPAPPPNQDINRKYSSETLALPALHSRNEHGNRQGQRTWRKKDRDANYWRRIYESPSLNKEEKLLTQLKGIDGLPWKEIVVKYNEKMGLDMRQPALQMRLTRLTCRMDNLLAGEVSQNTKESSTTSTYNNPQFSSQLPSPLPSPLSSSQQQSQQQLHFQQPPQQQHLKLLQLPQLSQQINSQSNYPYHVAQLSSPRLSSPPQPTVDPNFAREAIFLSQAPCTTLVPMSGSTLWPGTPGNSNYLNNLSVTSHLSDMLYYDSQTESQLSQRQPSNCNNPNSFKYMNGSTIY
ncbi:hypothetical protein OnM2_057022 [Erysiphe neolycopersici]|uniref:Uncharacterized protein n=1 Tax=Erysiphe neolycopersici TaxID=212602 RepID=A0A420HQS0_9PEZI|nr:hypothetical protein OnM2_057022 [Erysiphe neolycopersici]